MQTLQKIQLRVLTSHLLESQVADITLSVSGYKIRGVQHADLSWTTDYIGQINIFRDGSLITTTADDGSYDDNIGNKGGGSL